MFHKILAVLIFPIVILDVVMGKFLYKLPIKQSIKYNFELWKDEFWNGKFWR